MPPRQTISDFAHGQEEQPLGNDEQFPSLVRLHVSLDVALGNAERAVDDIGQDELYALSQAFHAACQELNGLGDGGAVAAADFGRKMAAAYLAAMVETHWLPPETTWASIGAEQQLRWTHTARHFFILQELDKGEGDQPQAHEDRQAAFFADKLRELRDGVAAARPTDDDETEKADAAFREWQKSLARAPQPPAGVPADGPTLADVLGRFLPPPAAEPAIAAAAPPAPADPLTLLSAKFDVPNF